LASSGEWGPVAGIPASGKSIRISNKYDSISFGVKVLEDKKYYDIFLSETSYSAGEVELSPKRSFLLWAEPNVEAGTVFTDAKMNAIEVCQIYCGYWIRPLMCSQHRSRSFLE
jgi:hypothetical protein